MSFNDPGEAGSYTRMLEKQIRELDSFKHHVISSQGTPTSRGIARAGRSAFLKIPFRLTRRSTGGIQNVDGYAFAQAALSEVRRLRPSIVVVYDDYKIGPMLRSHIDWPCRLLLSQHGHSYFLPVGEAQALYSYDCFHAVVVLAASAFRFERSRLHSYTSAVYVVPNSVDINMFSPGTENQKEDIREREGLEADALVFLSAGRLIAKKGAHLLLQQWREVQEERPDAFLWVVGSGDVAYRKELSRLAGRLPHPERVRFTGFVPRIALSDFLRAADCFVLPSLCQEGQPLAVLEAMASGLPCVISDFPSTLDLMGASEAVIAADPNIEGSLSGACLSFVADRSTMDVIGKRARQAIVERFSDEVALQRLGSVYEREMSFV